MRIPLKIVSTALFSFAAVVGFTQLNSVKIPVIQNFTIISSTGDTLNLYDNLNLGKTVILDFFRISCGTCQVYSRIIDSAYLYYNSGQNNVEIWGISDFDTDIEINQFKQQLGLTFPCAGIEGNGQNIFALFEAQQEAFGTPLYAVICPTNVYFWNANHPPTVTGFDPYISLCGNYNSIKEAETGKFHFELYLKTLTLSRHNQEKYFYQIVDVNGLIVGNGNFHNNVNINLQKLRTAPYVLIVFTNNEIVFRQKFILTE